MKVCLKLVSLAFAGFFLIGLTLYADISVGFPVPDTGVTECYDDLGNQITCPVEGNPFYGQDANYGPGIMSFVNNGDGTVTDNNTSLMWETKGGSDGISNVNNPNDIDNIYQWNSLSQDFISKLNQLKYGGYDDWRLPSAKELVSILDFSKPVPGPTVDLSYFTYCARGGYWSSDLDAVDAGMAWVVYFDTGLDDTQAKTSSFSARAVRAGY